MKGRIQYYEPFAYFTSRLMYSLNQYADKYNKYYQEEKILYKGGKLFLSYLLPYKKAENKIILLSSFILTTDNEEIAKAKAGRGKEREIYKNSSKFSVIFYIINKFKNGWISNGIDIQEFSKVKNEKKILFLPFSFYRVNSVNLNESNYIADIYLETIGKKEILEEKLKFGKEIKYNEDENIIEISS